MKKRLLAFSAALCLTLAVLPTLVTVKGIGGWFNAEETVTWTATDPDADGKRTLTIKGKGIIDSFDIDYDSLEVKDLDEDENFDDVAFVGSITTVIINDSDIDLIDIDICSEFPNLESVIIDSGLSAINSDMFSTIKNLEINSTNATSIEEEAFYGCTTLTSITIPSSVTQIGALAFADCTALKTVTIDDSSTLQEISDSAFSGCEALTSVTLPGNLITIGESAFADCTALPSVTIPSSVTQISAWAFAGCIELSSIGLPEKMKSIEDYAFYGCTKLGAITIPGSVTKIGAEAFSGCERLTSVIFSSDMELTCLDEQNEEVPVIDETAFSECNNLDHVEIPDTFKPNETYNLSFLGYAEKLTSAGPKNKGTKDYSIVYNWTNIPDYAFMGCDGLNDISIPKDATIGLQAFYSCDTVTLRFLEGWTIIPSTTSWPERDDLYINDLYLPSTLEPPIHPLCQDFVTSATKIIFAGTRSEWQALTKSWVDYDYTDENVICEDDPPFNIEVEIELSDDLFEGNPRDYVMVDTTAKIGDKVPVTVTPPPGYKLISLIVESADDNSFQEVLFDSEQVEEPDEEEPDVKNNITRQR